MDGERAVQWAGDLSRCNPASLLMNAGLDSSSHCGCLSKKKKKRCLRSKDDFTKKINNAFKCLGFGMLFVVVVIGKCNELGFIKCYN